MVSIHDPVVTRLLEQPNFAVLSTRGANGSIHSAVVWVDLEDGVPAVNSAAGRRWPANVDRDPRVTLLVHNRSDPYEYVEIRGRARLRSEGADAHIDSLAAKYLGVPAYPFRAEGERRISYLVEPEAVRYQKQ
jgi:PPOX class probable F420-dependent enzyme